MRSILIFSLIFICMSCHQEKKEQEGGYYIPTFASGHQKEFATYRKIKGYWTSVYDKNIFFHVGLGRIFNFKNKARHNFDIVGDSIRVFYKDSVYTALIKVDHDTLILTRKRQVNKYFKLHN